MPGRLIPLVNDHVYHVFNRGIDHRPTFTNILELKRAMSALDYYRFASPPMKLSKLLQLSVEERDRVKTRIKKENEKLIEVLAFCLMPNHFHFLLKQLPSNGISKFLSNFQNSYTRYFNTKSERNGPLFLDQFKAVLIETDEQLIHVSRYIHLNPLTSYVVKDFDSLLAYPWSSFPEYVTNKPVISDVETIFSFFKNPEDYTLFIKDQTAYQRELHKIKHLVFED